ncbi:hypothetical protein [Herbiconiux daphne]|uniref:Uncharacterized protein n=1 Tax=Herbiconiux daphne TaxID=2970914 RepID=A0ABT2GZJ6_9MICO|nr:hypothetical protein [Herbiconiux daphne]MCS5732475.1 hypothetical protein [Herbiconiux daphne]
MPTSRSGTNAAHPPFEAVLDRSSATEWSVLLTSSLACVGYVTDLGHGLFEAIDVLPPYRVAVVDGFDDAVDEILATIQVANESILSAYAR